MIRCVIRWVWVYLVFTNLTHWSAISKQIKLAFSHKYMTNLAINY